MTRILIIKKIGNYYIAAKRDGEIVFGGEYDVGGVDGSDASEVLRVAIKNANVIHVQEFDVVTEAEK